MRFNPPLIGSAIVGDGPGALAANVLAGSDPDAVSDWYGVMPAYADEAGLDDEGLADLLSYARAAFAGAGPVSPADVAGARARVSADR